MGIKKINGPKERDPDWILELVEGYLGKDIKNLSEYQKKMLRDTYLDYIKEGLKPKDALEKAFEIILCFNQ